MSSARSIRRRKHAGRLLIGGVAAAGAVAATAVATGESAGAAGTVTASFANGVLTVRGDAQPNNIVISRNAAGTIRVNGGAVPVSGGPATVANTTSMTLIGLPGADVITLDEAVGALPRADMFGGRGNDTLTGGSGGDRISGQGGDDTLLGKGGFDLLFGSTGNDTLTGGDADDQAFGGGGDDRMIWNPGDDTDLNEGGADTDTTAVIGGGGAEVFSTTANGARVRFDRLDPAPFSIDIGTTERLDLNANGGDDSYSATGNLAALIAVTVHGGADNDTILGTNGIDTLIGNDGNDFIDGQQGNDVAFLGAGSDVFQWDPGDGSDTIEGQAGADTMLFNGSAGDEIFETSANGARVRFTRNLGNIVMDTNDVEGIDLNALGGVDLLTVNDVTGTDLTAVETDLAGAIGGATGDGAADNVVVRGTNDDDSITVRGQGAAMEVTGLAARVTVANAEPGSDRLTISALDGDDVVDASQVAAGSMLLTLEGGAADDALIGGNGDDTINGDVGDDILIGGPGVDTLNGGPGDDVLLEGENNTDGAVVGQTWLNNHTRRVNRHTVLWNGDDEWVIPVADLGASS
jgi:Ca2+-binding RTX toxin-like protein